MGPVLDLLPALFVVAVVVAVGGVVSVVAGGVVAVVVAVGGVVLGVV